MADDASTVKLLARWQDGDEDAAEEIFQLYVGRLISLARSRLSSNVQRRIEAEDVVQSVFRSFFRRAREHEYVIERSGDLWRLLAAITVTKVRRGVKFHRAGKRNFENEKSLDAESGTYGIQPQMVAREPSVSEALALVEEVEVLANDLEPVHRHILELRLKGLSVAVVAQETNRTERTVQRVLKTVHHKLECRLRTVSNDKRVQE